MTIIGEERKEFFDSLKKEMFERVDREEEDLIKMAQGGSIPARKQLHAKYYCMVAD